MLITLFLQRYIFSTDFDPFGPLAKFLVRESVKDTKGGRGPQGRVNLKICFLEIDCVNLLNQLSKYVQKKTIRHSHIVAGAYAGDYNVYYWRENDEEVDYVMEKKGKLVAVEVKSNSRQWNSGLKTFSEKFHPYLSLVVGDGGMKAEDFMKADPALLFK